MPRLGPGLPELIHAESAEERPHLRMPSFGADSWMPGPSPIGLRLSAPGAEGSLYPHPARHARPWAWHPRVCHAQTRRIAEESDPVSLDGPFRPQLVDARAGPGMTVERLRACWMETSSGAGIGRLAQKIVRCRRDLAFRSELARSCFPAKH